MKIRTQLLLANLVSIGVIGVFLIFSYIEMVLPPKVFNLLVLITLVATVLSTIVHFYLTQPIIKSIQDISDGAEKIREGNFNDQLKGSKIVELHTMAVNFNEMNNQLQKTFQHLTKSESSRKQLIANISHDLRTPIASIQAFTEALEDGVVEDQETFQQYLRTLNLETQRLSHLIDELFQLSQLDIEEVTLDRQSYHLDQLILETLQNQWFQIENKKLEVDVDLPERLMPVLIDSEKMKQAIINLLENAIRYSPIKGTIKIVGRQDVKGYMKISIIDEGPGISPEDIPHIFERLYRGEKSRNKETGGSGLGLAIAKSIIELHSGEIGVEQNTKAGCTFWFTIPEGK
ncbi:sensor histidine kinase [Priestia aryabhattai]|uniref:sensor histidine kinase n=1 Tax=Priestia aryabhattai TaxID=412384 RepID=UPI0027E492CE|nr:HAMP domain-containing sensor histidine kinase [Priestia aryabhattai]WJX02211.1 HAMP domain-containing sensor histidine kinase [Priestia aryabhattai]